MNVDIEAMQRRIAELEQRAVMLAARQDPSVREEFDDLLATLVKTSRVLLRVIDNAQSEKEGTDYHLARSRGTSRVQGFATATSAPE